MATERTYKKVTWGLIIALSLVALTLIAVGIAYGVQMSQNKAYANNLEAIYSRNFYELVDNINNTETKLNKVLLSSSNTYSSKLLSEISENADHAQNNISTLPVSISGIEDSIRFINQMGGYTSTLSKKLTGGEKLSDEDKTTLSSLYDCVVNMKIALNNMCKDLQRGYSILSNSVSMKGDYNSFTSDFAVIKPSDIDYPTMIYDGPFSDSQINKEINGLKGKEVTKEQAEQNLRERFANLKKVEFLGESNGWYTTYNFRAVSSENITLYANLTKIGGHILTVSGTNTSDSKTITLENAISNAKEFAKTNGIGDVECVWSDMIGNDAYLNLAPIVNKTILYPDLVKVKVDLATGTIVGYEATSYFANHVDRNIPSPQLGATEARNKISTKFNIDTQKIALIPLEYNREVLTYEFKCTYNGATYYLYINANTGEEENILKVIETDDGNKLL